MHISSVFFLIVIVKLPGVTVGARKGAITESTFASLKDDDFSEKIGREEIIGQSPHASFEDEYVQFRVF